MCKPAPCQAVPFLRRGDEQSGLLGDNRIKIPCVSLVESVRTRQSYRSIASSNAQRTVSSAMGQLSGCSRLVQSCIRSEHKALVGAMYTAVPFDVVRSKRITASSKRTVYSARRVRSSAKEGCSNIKASPCPSQSESRRDKACQS